MGKPSRPVGIYILGDLVPSQIMEISRKIENEGFTDIWIAEDCYMISGFSSAALALAATREVRVGIGAVSNRVRHPAVTAMEASTLAGAFGKRFNNLGIAHGATFWMKQMGLHPKSVLTTLRESVNAIKALARGETVQAQGEYYKLDDIALTHKCPSLQVLTAVVGEKSVALTAEIADGIIISVLGGPEYVRRLTEQVTEARRKLGIETPFQIVAYALTCVNEDRATARRKIRDAAAFYLTIMGPTAMTEAYGYNDDLGRLLKEGNGAIAADAIPEEWLDTLTVVGEPEDIRAGIDALYKAGATSVVLCIAPSEELPEQLTLIGEQVLEKV